MDEQVEAATLLTLINPVSGTCNAGIDSNENVGVFRTKKSTSCFDVVQDQGYSK